MGWSGFAIDVSFTAATFGAAVLSLIIGRLSDRFRRKPFLLGYECLTVLRGLTPLLTTAMAPMVAAIVVGGSAGA